MVTATVLEQVVQALVRGERVAAVARAYGVHLATCPGSAIPRSSARTSSAARSQHCEAERTPVLAGRPAEDRHPPNGAVRRGRGGDGKHAERNGGEQPFAVGVEHGQAVIDREWKDPRAMAHRIHSASYGRTTSHELPGRHPGCMRQRALASESGQ